MNKLNPKVPVDRLTKIRMEYEKTIDDLEIKNKKFEEENSDILKRFQNSERLDCETVEMHFDPKATASVVAGLKDKITTLETLVKDLNDRNTELKNERQGYLKDKLSLETRVKGLTEAIDKCLNSGRLEYRWAEILQEARNKALNPEKV